MPVTGDFSLGYNEGLAADDSGDGLPLNTPNSIVVPIPTIVMLGSDNGFLARRRGANDYAVAYADEYDQATNPRSGAPHPGAHAYRSIQVEQLSWMITSDKWIALLEDEFSGGRYAGFAFTTNNAVTWQRSDLNGSPGDPPPMDSNRLANGLDGETSPISEDGRIWSIENPASVNTWGTSSDFGRSFTNQFVPYGTPSGSKTYWISDGWIWGIRLNGIVLAGSPYVLNRQAIDGTNTTSFSFTWPSGFSNMQDGAINGYYGTNRLYAWNYLISSPSHILSVDITDPDVPVEAWTLVSSIGLSGSKNIHNIIPITNQIGIMLATDLTFGSSPHSSGSIWRTTDGGATWTKIVDYTPHLNPIGTPEDGALQEDLVRVNTDGYNVVVAATPPYCYISFDQGATFTEETVDMSIFTGYAGVAPTHWLSCAISGPNGTIPPPPPPDVNPGGERSPNAGADPITGALWGPVYPPP